MHLSKKAIEDLRIALRKTFGEDFDGALTDEEINEIGLSIIVPMVEDLKIRVLEA